MRTYYFLPLLFLLVYGSGCVSYQELRNFNQASFPLNAPDSITNQDAMRIQANDLLRIQVSSPNPEASLPFNEQIGAGMAQLNGPNLQLFSGYLVDQEGAINFPVLGRMVVADLTLEELKDELTSQLSTYLNDHSVNVRFLNFKVTVLGEVNAPGIVSLTNPRLTLLEAIGAAGDLSDYANRESVLIVREKNGERSFARIDLHSDDFFHSPFYYLQQNDVVYVEPIRARTATVADPGRRWLSYGSAVISLAALIFTLTRN
ncbi:MAG: polysaccharide biosynthesis/export family protein [Bacteroidota bacterium]